ncbi:transketolase [Clostridium sp.]|jgi:transketolase|uniref:transketolase n=1 Tax=Clostridium sp. TaxID=1506 RepID=UPI00258AFA41|nr:transketolase [Clostridium sp.]MDF2504722.1 transketolase, beta subunit [Clostridium sp.]
MNESENNFLMEKSKHIRRLTIDEIGILGIGHIGGCLSIVEALVVLYYKHMNIDPLNPKKEGRDRFVLSKGHAGPTLYSILADKGYFPLEELHTLNQPGTNLPSHCDMLRTTGIDMTTGSLGQGLSCAVGMAKASKIKKDSAYIYAVVGDGESQEGQIWEAAMLSSHLKLNNLIAFTDHNKLQIDGAVRDINNLESLQDKWKSFGWNVINVIDGHDIEEIDEAVTEAKKSMKKPTMIILNTIKGKGISFVENKGAANHNMPFGEEDKIKALQELN